MFAGFGSGFALAYAEAPPMMFCFVFSLIGTRAEG